MYQTLCRNSSWITLVGDIKYRKPVKLEGPNRVHTSAKINNGHLKFGITISAYVQLVII